MKSSSSCDKIDFRKVDPACDYFFISAVRMESSFYLDNANDFDASMVKEFLKKHEKNYQIVLLFKKRIGYLRLNIIEYKGRKVQSIGLDLAKKYRGQGLAVPIYKKIIKRLQKYDLPIVLWVLDFNVRALHLYTKLGFIEINRSLFVQAGSNVQCQKIMMEYCPNLSYAISK